MLPGCTQILCGSLGQEGSGNYCLLQKLQEEGYALLLKPVLAFTVAANGLKRDQDTYRDTLFCTLTKYQKIKNAFQEDLCSLKYLPQYHLHFFFCGMWCKALFPLKIFGSDMTIPSAR